MKFPRIADAIYRQLRKRVLLKRPPDYIVGELNPAGAYLERWFLVFWRHWRRPDDIKVPTFERIKSYISTLLPSLYLHQFLRDDDDRALHDHPSWGISLILSGSYIEHTIAAGGVHHRKHYGPGTLRFFRAKHAHRIELVRYSVRDEQFTLPAFTLFLFGPAAFGRLWGFHCKDRWIPWYEFTAPGKPGEVGPGCDA